MQGGRLLWCTALIIIYASIATALKQIPIQQDDIINDDHDISSFLHKGFSSGAFAGNGGIQVGVGKYDVTGPAAEINMMGYAMPGQRSAGVHTRLWSRAFVFVDENGNRAVYVSSDLCMTMQSFKMTVIDRLQKIFGPTMYTHDNVLLSGIHTHSGPGGYSWYALYDITSLGFSVESFEAAVSGIVEAIVIAHGNVKSAQLFTDVGELDNSNINRSPSAYLANPEEERAQYPQGDTDKNMTTLRIVDSNNTDMAAISWFPVHCTSMNNTNKLISGDNKGFASYLFERQMNGWETPFMNGSFVAAFAQANEGDVSPNTRGAKCPDGRDCSMNSSTCNGKNEQCIAHGPGVDMFDSTRIIGTQQYEMAYSLYKSANNEVRGAVNYRHMFVDMTNVSVVDQNGKYVGKTCRAAVGYSFAAGTTDGPGAFNFVQDDNKTSGNPFWNFIGDFVAKPTPDQIACHAPKPILLDVGQVEPIPWSPEIIPVQIVTVGQLVLLGVPGEFTTMSGRRLRNTVQAVFEAAGYNDTIVLVCGLSNTYTHYITTFEEYQDQRYEGASTIFGPHSLQAYQMLFSQLASAIIAGLPVPAGPTPADLSEKVVNFNPPVIVDTHPIGGHFGQVYQDVSSSYQQGEEVTVVFWGANPRNNLMTSSTFLTVEVQEEETQEWKVILTDLDWDTRFLWKKHDIVGSESLNTIIWTMDPATPTGTYRIRHFGYSKNDPVSEQMTPYTGVSSTFTVV